MELYGIIGKPLGHSFSRKYFTDFFENTGLDAQYVPFELANITELPDIITTHSNLIGLNVTIPYKEQVIPFLDGMDKAAEAIGAVNVIRVIRGNDRKTILIGYNTDYLGFCRSITPLLQPYHRRALVLGTGGASKAVCYALKERGLSVTCVSRTPQPNQLSYADLTQEIIETHSVIVNATPLGTAPNTGYCPDIPYEYLHKEHLCYDLVYNPERTLFLQKAEAQGSVTKNGLEMLHIQAEEAWKIWKKATK